MMRSLGCVVILLINEGHGAIGEVENRKCRQRYECKRAPSELIHQVRYFIIKTFSLEYDSFWCILKSSVIRCGKYFNDHRLLSRYRIFKLLYGTFTQVNRGYKLKIAEDTQ